MQEKFVQTEGLSARVRAGDFRVAAFHAGDFHSGDLRADDLRAGDFHAAVTTDRLLRLAFRWSLETFPQ